MQIRRESPTAYLEPEIVSNPLPMVGVAIVTGIAIELGIHSSVVDGDAPGIGVTIGVLVAVIGLIQGGRLAGHKAGSLSRGRYLAAIGFAGLVCFRASPVLAFINLSSAIGLLGAAVALHHHEARKPNTLTDFARTGKDLAFHGAFGAALVMGRDLPALESTTSWETARRVLVGAAIAFPLLLVFGGLFVSADEVFGDFVRRVTAFEVSAGVTQGLVLAAALAWTILGLLRRAVTRPRRPQPLVETRRLGRTESLTIMWLTNSLFTLFVAFQVFELLASYQSADVSYAQQARNGFFQLVAVATVVVAVVLLMDWLVEVDPAGRNRLRSHHLVLIGLTTAVLGSAVVRMGFYVEAYGLTELRFYASAFMIWIGFLLVWLIRTVLDGRRQRFARPALAVLLVVVATLNLINPDSLIASYNLENQARSGPAVDTTYLVSALSADAVPTILQRLDSGGDPCAQLVLIEQLTVEPTRDIRSWNLARSRATALLVTVRDGLEESCQTP